MTATGGSWPETPNVLQGDAGCGGNHSLCPTCPPTFHLIVCVVVGRDGVQMLRCHPGAFWRSGSCSYSRAKEVAGGGQSGQGHRWGQKNRADTDPEPHPLGEAEPRWGPGPGPETGHGSAGPCLCALPAGAGHWWGPRRGTG